jgi:hypothetical protein
MKHNNNTKKILHVCHGLYGETNGVDRYIKTFTELINANHIILVPKGLNKSNLDNVIEIESLSIIPKIVQDLNIDFLIIHWTGAECFNEELSGNWIKLGNEFLKTTDREITIDLTPFAYADITRLFNDNKKHKTIIITHSEYPLPEYLTDEEVDFIVHVSKKCLRKNDHLLYIKQGIIYPTFNNKFSEIIHTKKSNKIRIGWLGRINKYDNKIYSFLKKNYANRNDLQFVFAGHGRIDKKPPKNFKFVGSIPAEKFFENIDIFLYPTTIDSFSLSLLEAIVQNKICITSKVTEDLAKLCQIETYNNEFDLYHKIENKITFINLKKGLEIPEEYERKLINDSCKLAHRLFSNTAFTNSFERVFDKISSNKILVKYIIFVTLYIIILK